MEKKKSKSYSIPFTVAVTTGGTSPVIPIPGGALLRHATLFKPTDVPLMFGNLFLSDPERNIDYGLDAGYIFGKLDWHGEILIPLERNVGVQGSMGNLSGAAFEGKVFALYEIPFEEGP